MRYLAVFLGLIATVATAGAATVSTDFPDYAPGDTVTITGSGWEPGETVAITLHEDPAICGDREYTPTADANGDISDAEFVVDEHDVGVTFTVSASGGSSGLTAEATFTDGCGAGFVADETCPLSDTPNCTLGCRNLASGACDATLTSPAARGTVCRAKTDACDVAETCNGALKSCPADALAAPGTGCRAPAGPCDAAEVCTGTSAQCPPDGFAPSTLTCRPVAGPCDVPEKCSGRSAACPPDGFVPGGTKVCRLAVSECDVAESCNGLSALCPPDAKQPAGTPCGDQTANACTNPDTCDGRGKCSSNDVPCTTTTMTTSTTTSPTTSSSTTTSSTTTSSTTTSSTTTTTLPACGGPSTIRSNFNGTAIPAGRFIWFNSVLKVQGLGSSPVTVRCDNSQIQFTAAGTSYTLPVPNGSVTFSPSATTASTTFDVATNTWVTTLPSNLGGNAFLTGLSFPVATSIPGGVNPVTWTCQLSSDTPGVTINWQWAAAVYTSFSTVNAALGVKPVDNNQASVYKNSDHAGTPENFKAFVTGGARGGGGSNFTGSYSATGSAPCP